MDAGANRPVLQPDGNGRPAEPAQEPSSTADAGDARDLGRRDAHRVLDHAPRNGEARRGHPMRSGAGSSASTSSPAGSSSEGPRSGPEAWSRKTSAMLSGIWARAAAAATSMA